MNNFKKKKICIICTNADRSGAPLHVYDLVNNFSEKYEVHCIFGENGDVAKLIQPIAASVSIVPELRSSLNVITDISALRQINRLVQKIKPDILHLHSSKAGLLGRISARLNATPSIYTIHGWGFGPGRKKLQSYLVLGTEWLMSILDRKTRFIYVSNADEKQAKDSLSISSSRGAVVWNGISDCNKRAKPYSSENIVMVSRVAFQKDHQTLLKSFEKLDFGSLHLIGEGTDTAEFKALAKQLAPTRYSQIHYYGKSQNIDTHLSEAGVFVLSSFYEGLPLSIIEAMRSGLPIVATDVGGNNELVIDGFNGKLTKIQDEASLVNALELFKDPENRKKFGINSRARYEKLFSQKEMINSIDLIYQSLSP